jgi:hypothetical protein
MFRVRGLDGMSLPWISLSPHELAENTAGKSYHSDGCIDIPVQPLLSAKSPLPADWSLRSLSLASIEQAASTLDDASLLGRKTCR